MKAFIASFSFLFVSGVAHADMIKPATLDIVCNSTSSRVIRILSNSDGSEVTVDGKTVLQQERPLTGGTEGGAPYLQAIGGGYNITIEGGDFEKAFYTSSSIEGEARAIVGTRTTPDENAICNGTFSF